MGVEVTVIFHLLFSVLVPYGTGIGTVPGQGAGTGVQSPGKVAPFPRKANMHIFFCKSCLVHLSLFSFPFFLQFREVELESLCLQEDIKVSASQDFF